MPDERRNHFRTRCLVTFKSGCLEKSLETLVHYEWEKKLHATSSHWTLLCIYS